MTDFVDNNGNNSRGNPSALATAGPAGGDGRKGSSGFDGGRRGSTDPYGQRKGSNEKTGSKPGQGATGLGKELRSRQSSRDQLGSGLGDHEDGLQDTDGRRKASDGLGRDDDGFGDPYAARRGSTNPERSRKGSREGDRSGPMDPNGRRKASTDPDSLHGLLPDGSIPEGTAVISVVKARGLAKADMVGKSDPYVVLEYGKQKKKSPVINNTLEPQWDFAAEFKIPEKNEEVLNLEVFDSDRIGKDKSLGKLSLPLVDVLAMDGQDGRWFHLAGSKDGEVLLMTDFVDRYGKDSRGNPSVLATAGPAGGDGGSGGFTDPYGQRKGSNEKTGSKPGQEATGLGKELRSRQGSRDQLGSGLGDDEDELRETDAARRGSTNPDGSRKGSKDLDGGRRASDGSRKGSRDLDGGRGGSRDPEGNQSRPMDPFGRRKASTDPDSMHGLLPDGSIPEGTAIVSIVKARGLAKTDVVGKSDPYVVLEYGKQKQKSPVIKNTQEPQWDFTAEFKIPDEDEEIINLEVLDSDRFGKDKSLGKLNLPLVDLLALDAQDGRWFPLAGSKDGEVLLMTDFVDANGNDSRGNPSSLVNPMSRDRLTNKGSKSKSGIPGLDGLPDGKAKVCLVKAKDLIKTDIVGKSDPYALVRHGEQQFKTPTVKNSQEPEWDAEMEFEIPDGDDSLIHIEIYDEDSVGPDKFMGSVDLPLGDLASMNPEEGYWFPLEGVKSGQVLLTGEVVEALGEIGDDDSALLDSGLRKGSGQRGSVSADKTGRAGPGSGVRGPRVGFEELLPEGQITINLVKAKDLVKSDLMGKSDPYAVLKFGGQTEKTPTEKNTQNPQWDYDATFEVPDGNDKTVYIEVFDSNKLGKDKSLGKLNLGMGLLTDDGGLQPQWFDLEGVKSGQLLLCSDFIDDKDDSRRNPAGGLSDVDRAADKADKKKQALEMLGLGAIPEGKACIDLIKAKNLENADKKGKSDPYAVLKFGKQKAKTNTVRNTQNPQWDFSKEFDVPDGDDTIIDIEVFDNDKLGRDKSLGSLSLGLDEILQAPEGEALWYPLEGVKSGELLLAADFLPEGIDGTLEGSSGGQPILGGKGSGQADPSKVKAYGPGLEEGKVMPGKPATFTVDSSKTGPAPLIVDMDSERGGRRPSIREVGPGKHEVTYVPPPVGEPYQVGLGDIHSDSRNTLTPT